MGVVSFRIPDEDEARLERAGISPGRAAKEHVEREARRLRAEHYMAELARFSRKPARPIADILREAREEH